MSKWLKFDFKWGLERFGIQMGDKRLILASRAIFSLKMKYAILSAWSRESRNLSLPPIGLPTLFSEDNQQ